MVILSEEVKRFLEPFEATDLKNDPLPIKVHRGKIAETEAVGEGVQYAFDYLYRRLCPLNLIQFASRVAADHVRGVVTEIASKEGVQNDCVDGDSQVSGTQPLQLMQMVVKAVDDVFIKLKETENDEAVKLMFPQYFRYYQSSVFETYQVSYFSMKNQRRIMEDKMVVHPAFHDIFQLDSQLSYFAVFDGHNGIEAASYGAAQFHQFLLESLKQGIDMKDALITAFRKTDETFILKCKSEKIRSGSTGTVVLIDKDKISIAWVGDCQVSLHFGNGQVKQMVEDHRPDRKDERSRIQELGGQVIELNGMSRVNGTLAVTRALGDPDFKDCVVCEPEIIEIERADLNEEYIVLATDGLWDFMSVLEVGRFVNDLVADNKANSVAELLAIEAKTKGSKDNISIIVVYLKPLEELSTLIKERAELPVTLYEGPIGKHMDAFSRERYQTQIDAAAKNKLNGNEDDQFVESEEAHLLVMDSKEDEADSSEDEWSFQQGQAPLLPASNSLTDGTFLEPNEVDQSSSSLETQKELSPSVHNDETQLIFIENHNDNQDEIGRLISTGAILNEMLPSTLTNVTQDEVAPPVFTNNVENEVLQLVSTNNNQEESALLVPTNNEVLPIVSAHVNQDVKANILIKTSVKIGTKQVSKASNAMTSKPKIVPGTKATTKPNGVSTKSTTLTSTKLNNNVQTKPKSDASLPLKPKLPAPPIVKSVTSPSKPKPASTNVANPVVNKLKPLSKVKEELFLEKARASKKLAELSSALPRDPKVVNVRQATRPPGLTPAVTTTRTTTTTASSTLKSKTAINGRTLPTSKTATTVPLSRPVTTSTSRLVANVAAKSALSKANVSLTSKSTRTVTTTSASSTTVGKTGVVVAPRPPRPLPSKTLVTARPTTGNTAKPKAPTLTNGARPATGTGVKTSVPLKRPPVDTAKASSSSLLHTRPTLVKPGPLKKPGGGVDPKKNAKNETNRKLKESAGQINENKEQTNASNKTAKEATQNEDHNGQTEANNSAAPKEVEQNGGANSDQTKAEVDLVSFEDGKELITID